MLKCDNCGQVFAEEEAKTFREYMGEHFGTPAYEEHACCPYCGADDLTEVEQCSLCGEYVEDLEAGACEDCRKKVIHDFTKMIESNFSGDQRKVIDYYEETRDAV